MITTLIVNTFAVIMSMFLMLIFLSPIIGTVLSICIFIKVKIKKNNNE